MSTNRNNNPANKENMESEFESAIPTIMRTKNADMPQLIQRINVSLLA